MTQRYSDCSILIPAYNEEATIGPILQEITDSDLFEEIIVVNDGSTDSTGEMVKEFPHVKLITNRTNMGNGASVRKGILKTTKPYVIVMDADGQHPPQKIKKLVDRAMDNQFDLVVASRKENRNVSRLRNVGNRVFEMLAGYLAGEKIEDLTCGFRVFRRSAVMKIIHLFPKRYSYPATSVLALLSLGYNVGYLRVPEIKARERGKSQVNIIRDFFRFLFIMLRTAIVFGPAKVFLPFALGVFLIGCADILLTIYYQNTIQELGVIMLILSFLTAAFGLLGEQLARIRIEIGTIVSNEISDLILTDEMKHREAVKKE